jgi:hypothetical protein
VYVSKFVIIARNHNIHATYRHKIGLRLADLHWDKVVDSEISFKGHMIHIIMLTFHFLLRH